MFHVYRACATCTITSMFAKGRRQVAIAPHEISQDLSCQWHTIKGAGYMVHGGFVLHMS